MANYSKFFSELIRTEGGYNPDDVGLPGKYGIRLNTWQTYGRDLNADGVINAADVPLITLDNAYELYKRVFWDVLKLDQVNDQALAELMFDHGVNAGTGRAAKMLQYILNETTGARLAIDGAIGPLTLSALNRADLKRVFDYFKLLRGQYYMYLAGQTTNIPTNTQDFFRNSLGIYPNATKYGQYLAGWLDRVNKFVYDHAEAIAVASGGFGILALIGAGVFLYSVTRENN